MEGLGCQGEAGPDTWAPTLTEEGPSEQRSRAQTADSGYASTLASSLRLYPSCATSASQANIMCQGNALGPEGGSNTVPRRGKRQGEGLTLDLGGVRTPARRGGGSGLDVTLGDIELHQRSECDDSVLGIHRDIHEGKEALLGLGERVTYGRGSEDRRKEVLLEPGQGVTHGRGSEDRSKEVLLGPVERVTHGRGSEDRGKEALMGPGERVTHGRGSEDPGQGLGLHTQRRGKEVLLGPGQGVTHGWGSEGPGWGLQEDTGSERIALELEEEGTSDQLWPLECTGPEARGDNQNGVLAPETEQQSPLLTPGSEASQGASPGNQSWMRKLLPPTEISSSPWFLVPCALVIVLAIVVAALLGSSSSQDAPVPPRFSPCPMDWLYSRNRCYFFSMMYGKEGDWDESQRFCSSQNGSLALFDTQEELNFLLHICSVKHMWVGLQKSGSEILWADGTACSSSLCKVPDSGDCAYIQDDALWVSGCDLKRPYICTKETISNQTALEKTCKVQ